MAQTQASGVQAITPVQQRNTIRGDVSEVHLPGANKKVCDKHMQEGVL
jgi:hypothetical protein